MLRTSLTVPSDAWLRELRKMAKRYMRRGPNHTLQTTVVVHEAYLKLVGGGARDLQNRAHFFAVASMAMRNFLVAHARARLTAKRGGDLAMLPLDEGLAAPVVREREIVALDDALNTLAKLNPRQAKVVELRYFGGLDPNETAEVLATSPRTVERDWDFAKAFLRREISRAPGGQ